MDLLGIIMMVLTYTLIGFGFACGFALFRWVADKRRARKRQKEIIAKHKPEAAAFAGRNILNGYSAQLNLIIQSCALCDRRLPSAWR